MDFDGTYDYVIVGGGTAGCVVARRLIERRDCRVLLIEAGGPDMRPAIHDAAVGMSATVLRDPDLTWPHATVSQPGLNGRRIPIAQGRVLGGGSSINAMLYVRGNRRDFDHWRELGNEGWGYSEVLPYFQRSEDFADGASAYRGVDGPLTIVHYERPSEASMAFAASVAGIGFAPAGSFDYNGERQENGALFYQSTRTKDNQRCSTAVAFLLPMIGRPNLAIRTGARATRILLEGSTAIGVEYTRGPMTMRARAKSEVIVTCGALATPQLLMLSGIGPADELARHGIMSIVDAQGVGQNLQDHLKLATTYASRRELGVPELVAEAGLFMYSQEGPPSASPDLQFLFGPTDGSTFTFTGVMAQPHARGRLTLRSAAPTEPPVVDPRYLDHDADLAVLLRSISISRELVRGNAFDPIRGEEVAPGPALTDRRALSEYVRDNATTMGHPVGTCRMGVDEYAVVDAQLRVAGVTGLRVADASVMPTITCGHPAAATIMIAERAAELIAGPARPGQG